MERLAGARIRKDGAMDTRNTSNMVIARYEHDSSRELDPQLHTHLVAGNLTYDGVGNKWKALASYDIYQQREYLAEVYRNALAREVTNLGYEVEDHLDTAKITVLVSRASRRPRSRSAASGARSATKLSRNFSGKTDGCRRMMKPHSSCGIAGRRN